MLHSPARIALRPFEYDSAPYTSGPARDRALRTAAGVLRAHGLSVVDDWAMPSIDLHCIVAQLDDTADASGVLALLNADKRVAWAQPVERFHALAASDPSRGRDVAPGWSGLDPLHGVATGRRVKIAQIDTGVDLSHPALLGQWFQPRNFVDSGPVPAEMHGTAVAGVMVARADRNTGMVGVSPGARVMPLRACWEAGSEGAQCSSFTLAKSLQFALRAEPRVINLSITGPQDRLLATLLDRAFDQGIVVVAAGDETGGPDFPASHPRVLAVYGSTSTAPLHAAFRAPSQDILTTTPKATFAFLSGTSFAAAHVSGLTALLLELSPRLTPAQVEQVLQSTAADQDHASRLVRVDPCAAISAVAPRPGFACPSASPPSAATRQ